MVRISRQENPVPSSYEKDVTISMPVDDETNDVYIRIAVENKVHFNICSITLIEQ